MDPLQHKQPLCYRQILQQEAKGLQELHCVVCVLCEIDSNSMPFRVDKAHVLLENARTFTDVHGRIRREMPLVGGSIMERKSAFTLVELMAVIVIMSVLANIAVGRIGEYTTKARCTEAVVTVSTFERLQVVYLSANGTVGSLLSIGMTTPSGGYFNYEAELELARKLTVADGDGGVQTAAGKGGGSSASGGGTKPGNTAHMVTVCHMTGDAGCHTIEVDDSGWENGLSPHGDILGTCDETCNGRLQYVASIVATADKYMTVFCRDGDGVFSETTAEGTVTRGNTTGGNCGKYMGAWFRQ